MVESAPEPPVGVPSISVVVVAYDMARELPRTLHSLDPTFQVGIDAADYEVLLVDNGSPEPPDPAMLERFTGRLRLLHPATPSPSPVAAANLGIREAGGDVVGLIVDGARIASPGLLGGARRATTLASRPVVTAPAWHLGDVPHMRAGEVGYDSDTEDALLGASGWERDGYQLFAHSTFAASSGRGMFAPMGESSSLFLERELWDEVGGLDEAFDLPGGGLANHDLFRRVCALAGAQLVVLLGEGTFHQIHGGAATSRRHSWQEHAEQYEAIRGEPFRLPTNEAWYFGTIPETALTHVEQSVVLARAWHERRRSR